MPKNPFASTKVALVFAVCIVEIGVVASLAFSSIILPERETSNRGEAEQQNAGAGSSSKDDIISESRMVDGLNVDDGTRKPLSRNLDPFGQYNPEGGR